ncbi:hypothetical protein [Nocardia niigatensis]|uniref:hypothetical protein n=1 Tax=Nocardia niigatensis TaxID=209249 RepID=UPI0012F65A66|nr:hypothetical protein [Nocardia niigatensis]
MGFPVLMPSQFPDFAGLDFRIEKIVPPTSGRALGKQETRSGFPVFSFHAAGTGVSFDVDHPAAERTQMVIYPPTVEGWVADGCHNSRIWPVSRQRAEGILTIHGTCEPPCPRAASARKYLEEVRADAHMRRHDR